MGSPVGENALGVKVLDTYTLFFLYFSKMHDTIPVMLNIYDTRSISLFSIFASIPAISPVVLALLRI